MKKTVLIGLSSSIAYLALIIGLFIRHMHFELTTDIWVKIDISRQFQDLFTNCSEATLNLAYSPHLQVTAGLTHIITILLLGVIPTAFVRTYRAFAPKGQAYISLRDHVRYTLVEAWPILVGLIVIPVSGILLYRYFFEWEFMRLVC